MLGFLLEDVASLQPYILPLEYAIENPQALHFDMASHLIPGSTAFTGRGAAVARISRQGGSEFNPWKAPNAHKKPTEKKGGGGSSSSSSSKGPPLRNMNISPPGLGSFKPPYMGFGERPKPSELSEEDKAAMVDKVRGRIGVWHERAKVIWELQQMGFTAEELYDAALVTSDLQTTMVVAAKVYDSLVAAESSSEVLSAFDEEAQISTLYALRTLSLTQRKAAAEYVIAKNLDSKSAQELARAIKEHERRPQGREGFIAVPGDCLALMHYRAATESSEHDKKRCFAQQALEAAVSESAKQHISNLLQKL